MSTPLRATTEQRAVIEFTARDHAYRFVCARGDEAVLMHAVRQMAEDPSEPLDWFDAALVAYELARHAERRRNQTTSHAHTSPSVSSPRNPFQSEH